MLLSLFPAFRRHARRLLCALVTAAALLASACAPAASTSDARLRAVATTGMVGDLAAQVGGARVQVSTLFGPGIDPHQYRAAPRDIQTLQSAQVIFRSGLNLEAKLGEIFDRLGERMPVIAVTSALPPEVVLSEPAYPDRPDPHVWFDVQLWAQGADVVAEALSTLDPAGAPEYAARAAAYRERLAALDAYAGQAIASIPAGQRVLVTAHDAFQYFGRRYGIEVSGLQGVSTEAEAGVQDVQRLVEFIVARQIPAIFVESSVPARTLEAVQQAAAAGGWDVQIGGQLYSDAMGDTGTLEGTYVGMILHNIATITHALGGTLPPLPEALADYQDVLTRARGAA